MNQSNQVFMWKCFALLGCSNREELQHLLVAITLETLESQTNLNVKEMRKKVLEHVEELLGKEASAKFRKIVL